MKRAKIVVHGEVQGVWFRATTDKIGKKLGLKGYVRNTSDGCVEIVCEGSEESIKTLLEFCNEGPELANVTKVDINYSEPNNEFTTFEIRY
ncbi:acylphosphatase [Nanoarchaeota archaeon]